MINDTKLVMETVSAVMRVEEMRAQAAAHTIAMANVPGATVQKFDASAQFQRLVAAVQDTGQLRSEVAQMAQATVDDYLQPATGASVSLDAQVLELSSASARYQALGEGVSRQLALMRLAISGGK